MQPFNKTLCAGCAGLVVALSGCSEYFDRRDAIAINAGNAVATDKVTQMVDPWPPASANKDIAYNGDTMEAAYTRYRTGKVIRPRGMDTSGSYAQSSQSSNAASNTTPVGPTVTQPAAPVK